MSLKKETALNNFFAEYEGIEGSMRGMSKAELSEYLDNDMFIVVASAASGIPEHEFRDYAPTYFNL